MGAHAFTGLCRNLSRLEGEQLFPEQLHAHGRAIILGKFLRQKRGKPVAAKQVAHRCARAGAGDDVEVRYRYYAGVLDAGSTFLHWVERRAGVAYRYDKLFACEVIGATGREPAFHEYEVKDVLAKEDVWFVDFNPDGWAVGDVWNTNPAPLPYDRGNGLGTDLNRQMPTVGRINSTQLARPDPPGCR